MVVASGTVNPTPRNLQVTLAHLALVIPGLGLAVSFALYRSAWIRNPHGLSGFANVIPVVACGTLVFGIVWARSQAAPDVRLRVVLIAIVFGVCLLVCPPQVLEFLHPGSEHHYSFVGHGWVLRWIEPRALLQSEFPTNYEFHTAFSLLAMELLFIAAAVVASLKWRRPTPSQQRPLMLERTRVSL